MDFGVVVGGKVVWMFDCVSVPLNPNSELSTEREQCSPRRLDQANSITRYFKGDMTANIIFTTGLGLVLN